MNFTNEKQIQIVKQLDFCCLNKKTVDKVVLHSDDNWINQLISNLSKTNNIYEAFNILLELFLLLKFNNQPQYISQKDLPKRFPVSQRKFDDMVRARAIPFIQLSQKARIFDIDEVYKSIQEYKVDSYINKIDPITLNKMINQLIKR